MISAMHHGSIFGPLLFNIFLNDLFFFVENSDLSNYADGSTLFSSDNNLEQVKQTLKGRLSNSRKMVLWNVYGAELG